MIKVKIREKRIELGISQSELARRCNNYQPHVSRWEKGEISYGTLKKVAKALGCTMDELVEDDNEPTADKT